jgi:hypothetical protein
VEDETVGSREECDKFRRQAGVAMGKGQVTTGKQLQLRAGPGSVRKTGKIMRITRGYKYENDNNGRELFN